MHYNMGELEYNKLVAKLQNIQIRLNGHGKYYIQRGWIVREKLYTPHNIYEILRKYRWSRKRCTIFDDVDAVGRVFHEEILKEGDCSVEVFVTKEKK